MKLFGLRSLGFLSLFCFFTLYGRAFASSEVCLNPTIAQKSVCDDLQRVGQAISAKDYSVASALLRSLKERVLATDPLASDVERLDKQLLESQNLPQRKPSDSESEPQSISKDKSRFRSDGWRKRTSSEIFSLYGVAIGHGIYTGFYASSFNKGNSGPASFGIGGLAGLVGSVGAVFFLDSGEGMRYGVPTGIDSFYSAGLETMGFTALFIDGLRRDNSSTGNKFDGADYVRFIWYGATGGAIFGGLLAQNEHLKPGQSVFISSAGNWAGLFGMGISSSLRKGRWLSTAVGASSLGANLAGLTASAVAVFGHDYSPSGATVQMINLAGSAGVLAGGLASLAIRNKDSSRRGLSALLAGGGALGLGLGWYLTRDADSDRTVTYDKESDKRKSWLENTSFALLPSDNSGLEAKVNFVW